MRKHAGKIALTTLVLAVLTGGLMYAFRGDSFVAGVVFGGMAVGWAMTISMLLALYDGAQRKFDGALAEQWTSQKLRKLGDGWRCFDNLEFDKSDVDHVLVGPQGVVAVETKFTRDPNKLRRSGFEGFWLGDPIKQARTSARLVQELLNNAGVSVSVRPALAIWGPGAQKYPEQSPRGVALLSGAQLGEWSARLPRSLEPLVPDVVAEARATLEAQMRSRSVARRLT